MEFKDIFSLKFRDIISLIVSIPITLYVNFRCLPFKTALKLPLFIGHKTQIGKLSRNIKFTCEPTPFMVRIGWGGTEGVDDSKKNYLLLGENGSITFHGRCTMSSGVSLVIEQGSLEIGKNFFCNRNCSFSCNDRVVIGDDGLFGWNIQILDSDNHKLMHRKQKDGKGHGPILLGDKVWVAAFSHILKNTQIPRGSVVAYHSVVTKKFEGEKLLIGGYPAKVLSDHVEWER